MTFKSALATALAITFFTAGSLKADEPKVMTTQSREIMKPGHTVEAHKQMPYMTPAEVNKMKAAQMHHMQPVHKDTVAPHKMGPQQKPQQKPQSAKKMKGHNTEGAGTSRTKPHNMGNALKGGAHINFSTDPNIYAKAIINLQDVIRAWVVANDADSNNYGDGTAFQSFLSVCTSYCNQNPNNCWQVSGISYANGAFNGLPIPGDRQTFLNCFHQGRHQNDYHYGGVYNFADLCYGECTSGTCGNADMRMGCKLLCCGEFQGNIKNCLGNNGPDTCNNYK